MIEKEYLPNFKTANMVIENHTITYDWGETTTVPENTYILCHGAEVTRHYMKVLAKELITRTNSKVILIDLPYHGDSFGDDSLIPNIDIHYYAEITAKFIQKLRENNKIVGSLTWLGWSMGGSIGLLMDLNGVNLDNLILLNSSPVWESIVKLQDNVPQITDVKQIKEVFKQFELADLYENMLDRERDLFLDNYNYITARPEIMVRDFQAILPDIYDIRENLKDIKSKTLIIGGNLDLIALPEQQELMYSRIPNSKLIMLEDSHSLLIKSIIAFDIITEIKSYYNHR